MKGQEEIKTQKYTKYNNPNALRNATSKKKVRIGQMRKMKKIIQHSSKHTHTINMHT